MLYGKPGKIYYEYKGNLRFAYNKFLQRFRLFKRCCLIGIKIIPKVGRNDLCPCGSGKKYKKCCGAYL
ncbi:MAG: SEC-C metal-binding domain-containing protein [Actinobacteria bacterium]|nr:SEC-C metal-binding domain-containing protein [Actinomycetota bacterium]